MNIKKSIQKFLKQSEKGQAIILIAFAFVGLVAMVGLVTDTGLLLIEYGKLKRSVDAAAIAAAQQYRVEAGTDEVNKESLENAAINFLNLNQIQNLSNVIVHSCEDTGADRPALCNPDPINNPRDNRKLVEVTASADVSFGFLRVLGFESVTLTTTSVGEAATLDLVLIIDTSAQMSYETGNEENCNATNNTNTCLSPYIEGSIDIGDDDPSVCNITDTCQPMRAVKDVALDFIDTLYFPYDRVAIVTMTSQHPGGSRSPMELTPLISDKDDIVDFINSINVFEPRVCDGTGDDEGACIKYVNGRYTGTICEIYELNVNTNPNVDPSSCPSSNIGGVLNLAAYALQGSDDPNEIRLDSFWVVVALLGGPANATDPFPSFPNGACPRNTWLLSQGQGPWCRDKYPSTRHDDNDTISYTNPISGEVFPVTSIYDADDYARDTADQLAGLISGNGVTIYTIGLGTPIKNPARDSSGAIISGEPPPAEDLLQYIAECAGEGVHDCDSLTEFDINHGQYFYAPDRASLSAIFDRIAKNIATKISQ
ncbi:MAG TPA: VWA domain-containing protein [Anaerolineales bacterium]|nr:VWA domain-containing protein [Anaerolineales bacterium]